MEVQHPARALPFALPQFDPYGTERFEQNTGVLRFARNDGQKQSEVGTRKKQIPPLR